MVVRLLADASSSVAADDTVSTTSPIKASKSRVILSTRRPRSILASASRAAASSAAFLAISACLNTCSVSAMTPISVFSPRCGTSTESSPLPSACIGFTIDAIPRERSRDEVEPHDDAGGDRGKHDAHDDIESEIVAFGGILRCGLGTSIVEIDGLRQGFVGFGGDHRDLLGNQLTRFVRNPADARTRCFDHLLDARHVSFPRARPILV